MSVHNEHEHESERETPISVAAFVFLAALFLASIAGHAIEYVRTHRAEQAKTQTREVVPHAVLGSKETRFVAPGTPGKDCR